MTARHWAVRDGRAVALPCDEDPDCLPLADDYDARCTTEPAATHDARCDSWHSNDPTGCTCRDDHGKQPRERDTTTRRPAAAAPTCDTETADQRAGA